MRDAADSEKGPERRCIVTGQTADRSGMVRFVVGPDGAVVPDVEGKLPGRGFWVTATRGSVAAAVAGRKFSRAARRDVRAAPGLGDEVAERLLRRCQDILGLARGAGQAVTGFDQVRQALDNGSAAVLLAASDASDDGRRKLRARRGDIPLVEALTVAELSLAFGRENVVHAALLAGGLASRFLSEATRFAGFRPQESSASSPDRGPGDAQAGDSE